jgi:hypothetical protein
MLMSKARHSAKAARPIGRYFSGGDSLPAASVGGAAGGFAGTSVVAGATGGAAGGTAVEVSDPFSGRIGPPGSALFVSPGAVEPAGDPDFGNVIPVLPLEDDEDAGTAPNASPRCFAQNRANKQSTIQIDAEMIVMRVNTSPALAPNALDPPMPPNAPASPPPRPRCTRTSKIKNIANSDNTRAKTALMDIHLVVLDEPRADQRQGEGETRRRRN